MSTSEPLYSHFQQAFLGYLPLASAPFSIFGSSLILYLILSEARQKLRSPYHRLMLGLSTLDFLNSLMMVVLGPWAVPEGTEFVVGARGTITTCEISGFFLNLIFGSMWYSLGLAVFFLSIVRFEMKQQRFARWIEPVFHFLAFTSPIANGIYAIASDWMNPMDILPGYCWTYDYPPGCNDSKEVECLRGDNYSGMVEASMILLIWVLIIICMVFLFTKVRNTEKRLQRYAGGRNVRLKRTKETGIQALLYILAFFFVFFPIVVMMTLKRSGVETTRENRGVYFTFALLSKLVSPLQGFFNAFIYLRKRFRTLTEDGGRLEFLRRVSSVVLLPLRPNTTTCTTGTAEPGPGNVESYDVCDEEMVQVGPSPSSKADGQVAPPQDGAPQDGDAS